MASIQQIMNMNFGTCISGDMVNKSNLEVKKCHKRGGKQYWEFQKGIIGRGMYYLTYLKNHTLIMKKRKPKIHPTTWNYYHKSGQIGIFDLDLCLGSDKKHQQLILEDCEDPDEPVSQRWKLQNLKNSLMDSN